MNEGGEMQMNDLELHYFLQSGCFFETVIHTSNEIFAYNDVMNCFIWNHVFPYGDIEDAEEFIIRAERFLQTRKRKPCIYLDETDYSQKVLSLLSSRGYTLLDEEAWMRYTDRLQLSSNDNYAELKMIRVADENMLDVFMSICSECFDPEYSQAINREYLRFQPHKDYEHYVFFYKSAPVSIGSFYYLDNRFIIHNVGVKEVFRKSGIGKETVKNLINNIYSFNDKADIILQCDGGGFAERMYSEVGFVPFYRRWGYVKE